MKLNKIRQSAGKTNALAYLTGVYLGDGYIAKPQGYYRFRLNTIDEDFAEATAYALEKINDFHPKIGCESVKKSDNLNYYVNANGEELAWLIEASDSRNKIPDFIWDLPREAKVHFVAGVMDSEGYCSNGTNNRKSLGLKATDDWIDDFYDLMEQLGVKVGKKGIEELPSGKTSTRFHFNIKSFTSKGCYFHIKRKSERVREWLKHRELHSNPQRLYVGRQPAKI